MVLRAPQHVHQPALAAAAVIQRKNTNGYRGMWSAKREAEVRTAVGTTRIPSGANTLNTIPGSVGA